MNEVLLQWGYLGLFVGTFLPIGAEALIIAYILLGGDPVVSVLAGIAGNWLRGFLIFRLSSLGKWEWLEKYFRIKKDKIEKYRDKIEKYGAITGIAAGFPVIGDVMAVGLGFLKANPWTFSLFMFIGKALRFGIPVLIMLWIKPMFGG